MGFIHKEVLNNILEIIFPDNLNCLKCNIPISSSNYFSLCKNCYKKIEYISEMCHKCGRNKKGASICFDCDNENYYFDRIFSVLDYNYASSSMIFKYKYAHHIYMSNYFAKLLKDYILENNIDFDFITGVPIFIRRERMRGFNQSYVIAKCIDKDKFYKIFSRKKETKYLSELKMTERFLEVKDAFEINSKELDKLVNKFYSVNGINKKIRILLIDDILTSGATVNELSKLLKKFLFNVEIIVLTVCNAKK